MPVPAEIVTAPPTPVVVDVDTPLAIVTVPVLPEDDEPVEMVIAPLRPALPATSELMNTAPE